MDDIDTQILTVMRSGPKSCYEVTDAIENSYGVTYPTKRVRNRLDSLCSYTYLTVRKENRGKGMPTNVYSLVEGTL